MKKLQALLLPLAIAAAVTACSKPAEQAAAAPVATTLEAPAAAPAVTEVKPVSGAYQLDPDHTGVLAQWTHFGFSTPSAHFRISEATLTYDAADVSKSSVEVTLPVASIDTFVPALDGHLKKADFFDVAKFPNATFKSTNVQAAGVNKLTVVGDLTIKDNTHPVTLDVTLNGAGKHAMTGQTAIGFSATGKIKRSDFGVGAFAPNVSDEVELRITGEGALPEVAAENATKE